MYDFRNILELNTRADAVLSSDEQLASLSVNGEISGFKVYTNSNGNTCYFTLKDNSSFISCIMFDQFYRTLNFVPEEGMKVRITGSLSVYPARGQYRIKVFTMSRVGVGDLAEQKKQLYDRLLREGIFDPAHKVRLPLLPGRIGVISSSNGAVIHDIITTLSRRNPYFDLLLYPSAVQGDSCAREVCEGIDYFTSTRKVDVIIIARGGGSIEDLWGFNDEGLARKIYDCDIPVISAVGHDTDISICDYAADVSAPTPTAAAELVMPSFAELKGRNDNLRDMLDFSMKGYMDGKRRALKYLSDNKALYTPLYNVELHRNKLISLDSKLRSSMDNEIKGLFSYLDSVCKRLELLGPSNTLKRGYSYVMKENMIVRSISQVKKGDDIKIVLHDGILNAKVENIKETTENGSE